MKDLQAPVKALFRPHNCPAGAGRWARSVILDIVEDALCLVSAHNDKSRKHAADHAACVDVLTLNGVVLFKVPQMLHLQIEVYTVVLFDDGTCLPGLRCTSGQSLHQNISSRPLIVNSFGMTLYHTNCTVQDWCPCWSRESTHVTAAPSGPLHQAGSPAF